MRFYEILAELELTLGGKRRLFDCDGHMGWPIRGVYFFFEDGENRSTSGSEPKVVRIGTHALKLNSESTLWQRLSQHRGTMKAGNHRGSIFRLLIGEALKSKMQEIEPRSWGVCSDASKAALKFGCALQDIKVCERELEILVSQYVGKIFFLWLAIEDEPGPKSLRGYIERNSIALLSNYNGEIVDPASATWLGQFSSHERVSRSGLWNNNHVNESYAPDFLDRFAGLI
jgi:hypothetical protein